MRGETRPYPEFDPKTMDRAKYNQALMGVCSVTDAVRLQVEGAGSFLMSDEQILALPAGSYPDGIEAMHDALEAELRWARSR